METTKHDFNIERDPYTPEWLPLKPLQTLYTLYVLHLVVPVAGLEHGLILTKAAPELWSKHPEKAYAEQLSYTVEDVTFHLAGRKTPTGETRGVFYYAAEEITLTQAKLLVQNAKGWVAQGHKQDGDKWFGRT